MADISQRIRKLRKERNLTQLELANALGITKSAVSMYERGERKPAFDAAEALSQFFGVSMPYLSGSSDERGFYNESGDDASSALRRVSHEEYNIILKYREASPELKQAVCRLLEIR